MKLALILGISLGGGTLLLLPCLIGIVVIIVKFFILRCRKRPWKDIENLTDHSVDWETGTIFTTRSSPSSNDQRPLYAASGSHSDLQISTSHVIIPMDAGDESNIEIPSKPTIVQSSRERLNRIKQEFRQSQVILDPLEIERQVRTAIDQCERELNT